MRRSPPRIILTPPFVLPSDLGSSKIPAVLFRRWKMLHSEARDPTLNDGDDQTLPAPGTTGSAAQLSKSAKCRTYWRLR